VRRVKRCLVAVCAVLAACSSTTTESASTSIPTASTTAQVSTTGQAVSTVQESSTVPAPRTTITTDAGSSTSRANGAPTTPPTSAEQVADAIVGALPDDPTCAFGDAPERGQVTFVADQFLWGVDDRGAVSCLMDLGSSPPPQRLVWGPAADRLLLDGNRVATAGGVTDSGFFADNTDVEFSAPTGKRTFAATNDGKLKKREVTNASATEITFLVDHSLSAYHPAGVQIATVGHLGSADGPLSIQLASNEGAGAREIVDASDASQITELRFDYDGTRLFFIGEHDDGWHLNRLDFPGLELEKLEIFDDRISRLTVSSVDPFATAVQVGECGGRSTPHTKVFQLKYRDLADDPTLGTLATAPIGWLPDGSLVVSAQDASCAGPVDLWVWNAQRPAQLLVRDVDAAAVRIQAASAEPLPDDIESQAPA
jgi:hypothetical protein